MYFFACVWVHMYAHAMWKPWVIVGVHLPLLFTLFSEAGAKLNS